MRLSLAIASLSALNVLVLPGTPSAAHCLRRPRRHHELEETGRNIPFRIENYAFVDQFGRETVSWLRTFQSRRTRRFDAYMVYSETRQRIVDYLGSHQHLAVDIDLRVWGPLFGYRGRFDVEWRLISDVPKHILPHRLESRDCAAWDER